MAKIDGVVFTAHPEQSVDRQTGEIVKIQPPFMRTEYNYNRDQASAECATHNTEPSMTKQEFAAEADINVLVERMGLGYTMPINTTPPMQGDFTQIPDYEGAIALTRQAQEVFNALPAKIRNRFQNDPEKYMEFFHDEDNREEAIKLGLVKPKPVVQDTPKDPQTPPEGKKTG